MAANPRFSTGEAIDEANAANFVDFFLSLGASPGAAREVCDGFVRVSGPIPHPFYNFIYGFDVVARADDLDRAIGDALAPFRARRCAMMWIVFPKREPDAERLEARLVAAGLRLFADYRGMAVDLDALTEPPPPDLTIARVADEQAMREWVEVQTACDPEIHQPIEAVRVQFAAQRGFAVDRPHQMYLAKRVGAPVGCAILHVAAGVAGLHQVAVLPEARRRGVARALALRVLSEGRARGCRVGVLHSTPMAENLYRSIGFCDRPPVKVFVDLPQSA